MAEPFDTGFTMPTPAGLSNVAQAAQATMQRARQSVLSKTSTATAQGMGAAIAAGSGVQQRIGANLAAAQAAINAAAGQVAQAIASNTAAAQELIAGATSQTAMPNLVAPTTAAAAAPLPATSGSSPATGPYWIDCDSNGNPDIVQRPIAPSGLSNGPYSDPFQAKQALVSGAGMSVCNAYARFKALGLPIPPPAGRSAPGTTTQPPPGTTQPPSTIPPPGTVQPPTVVPPGVSSNPQPGWYYYYYSCGTGTEACDRKFLQDIPSNVVPLQILSYYGPFSSEQAAIDDMTAKGSSCPEVGQSPSVACSPLHPPTPPPPTPPPPPPGGAACCNPDLGPLGNLFLNPDSLAEVDKFYGWYGDDLRALLAGKTAADLQKAKQDSSPIYQGLPNFSGPRQPVTQAAGGPQNPQGG